MGAQATSHEYTVQESPSRGRCGVATQRTSDKTWLHINSLLFCHAIDHQQFMVWLINRSQEAIQALHDQNWEVVRRVMESAGKSAADGLGITLHLVSMLPTIPLQPAFNTVTPKPPGYTPRALTYASQDSIDRGAMSVLGEELIRDPTRGHDQVMQASSHTTATDTVSTRFTTVEGTGDDRPGPNFSPHAQRTLPAAHRSAPIVPDSMEDSPILGIPVCWVLTAQSLVNQCPTPKRLRVIPTVEGDLAPIPLTSFY